MNLSELLQAPFCELLGPIDRVRATEMKRLWRGVEAVAATTGVNVPEPGGPEAWRHDDATLWRALPDLPRMRVWGADFYGMRFAEAQPRSTLELAAVYALFRPGGFNRYRDFVNTAGRLTDRDVLPPCVRELLAPTRGMVVFRAQLAAIVVRLSGWDAATCESWQRRNREPQGQARLSAEAGLLTTVLLPWFKASEASAAAHVLLQFCRVAFCERMAIANARLTYRTAWAALYRPDRWNLDVSANDATFCRESTAETPAASETMGSVFATV